MLKQIPEDKRDALITILENDPRPSYKEEGEREYGMKYAGFDVFFTVNDGVLTVTRLEKE